MPPEHQHTRHESRQKDSPTNNPSAPPSPSPSATPTSLPSSFPTESQLGAFADILLPGVDLSLLDQTSSQYMALQWIAEEDPKGMLAVETTELVERFSLATFYYATNGMEWTSDLLWLSETHHCDWEYVECDNEAKFIESLSIKVLYSAFNSQDTQVFGLW